MPLTLTQAATLTKKIAVFAVIFFILLTITVLGVQAYLNAQKAKIVPPEEKPTLAYGLLPKPKLNPTLTKSSSYNFILNTQNGALEQPENPFPKLIKVYFIPKLGATLLARDRASELAKRLKFTEGPEIVTPTTYRFSDPTGGNLTINLDTNNFKFTRPESSPSAEIPFDETLPNETDIVKNFQNYLSSNDLYKSQLDQGKTKVEYDKLTPEGSNLALISLWQSSVDEIPIVTSSFTQGLIRTTVNKASEDNYKYIALDYNYWEVDSKNFATYPLKTIKTAYEQLQNGQSSVVIEPVSPQVSIAKIYLAYLISKDYSAYLQPVYVFEGENNTFAALVSAIPDENHEK